MVQHFFWFYKPHLHTNVLVFQLDRSPRISEDQSRPKKLLDQVRDAIWLKHYSYRTEVSYVDWIRRFILFQNKRHPREMGVVEIEAFLTYLAVQQRVAASTQN